MRATLLFAIAATLGMVVWLWRDIASFTMYEPYMPHGFCFMWNPHLMTLHITSDGMIGLAYFTISALLAYIAVKNRKLIPFQWMFLAFGAFIILCGFTHWMGIVVLWKPYYWFEGELKLVTAVMSVLTACLLPPLAPKIKKLLQDAENSSKAQAQREQAYAFTRSIIESSAFTIVVTDEHGKINAMNAAGERLLWFTPADLIGKKNVLDVFDMLPMETVKDKRVMDTATSEQTAFDALTVRARSGLVDEGEFTFIRKDDAKIPVHVTVTSLTGATDDNGFMFTAFDITERLRSQEYIRHVATHDSLTGLPSRILFRDRLEIALARMKRFGERVAILMVDLDNFKRINDSLGHHAGDEALIVIAQRLKEAVRGTDTVARMGGDEFMVILCDVQETMVEELAGKILRAMSEPISLGNQEVYITASIGICSDLDDHDAITLLKHADLALYKSKADGKNQVNRYTADMAHATVERLQMEANLRSAVLRNELHLVFQPQMSLGTNLMTGVEALVRWPRKNGEVTMPAEFIPLAEEAGLIVPIGEWVLNRACEEGAKLIRRLGREVTIAVNISPRQFKDRGIVHAVRTALEKHMLPARCLELEITESLLMQGSTETLDNMAQIRDMGVRMALDDFGTGFSSMSYITRFSIDRIKIDQSFVRGILKDPNSNAVVKAIIAMAHGLGITVVAEGTETEAEAERLVSLKCDEAQGYLYARPMDAEMLEMAMA